MNFLLKQPSVFIQKAVFFFFLFILQKYSCFHLFEPTGTTPSGRRKGSFLADSAKESESVRAQYVIDQIAEIVRDTNIPTDLNQYGVSMENLDFLVTAGSQQQRLLVNNCKELSLEDIREIYLKVLK